MSKRSLLGFDSVSSEDEEVSAGEEECGLRIVPGRAARGGGLELKKRKPVDQDSEIYQYDEHYEDIQQAKKLKFGAQDAQDDGRPKFMDQIIRAKNQREFDKLKLSEIKIAKERELEAPELRDKDVFVTANYRRYKEELSRISSGEEVGIDLKKFKTGAAGAGSVRPSTPAAAQPSTASSTSTQHPLRYKKVPKLSAQELQQYRDRYLKRRSC